MAHINAYINFDGNCTEVMNFYKDCLGGVLSIQTVGNSPMAPQCPAAMHDQVLHAVLASGSMVIMGSDMQGQEPFVKGDNIALSVSCTSEEEINDFYHKLSAGGTIAEPLGVMFWGATFAAFTDKYGIRWMLNYDKALQGK